MAAIRRVLPARPGLAVVVLCGLVGLPAAAAVVVALRAPPSPDVAERGAGAAPPAESPEARPEPPRDAGEPDAAAPAPDPAEEARPARARRHLERGWIVTIMIAAMTKAARAPTAAALRAPRPRPALERAIRFAFARPTAPGRRG